MAGETVGRESLAAKAARLGVPGIVAREPSGPPVGTRLVLVADDLLESIGTRTEHGCRLSFEWGEPDEHGWYTPLLTEHHDDNLAAAAHREGWDAALAAVREAVGGLPGREAQGLVRGSLVKIPDNKWLARAAVLGVLARLAAEGPKP